MKRIKPPPIENGRDWSERTWPLDLSIAALAGIVLYIIVTRLRFDDPRWLFNAWTYAIAVPAVALALAFVSHGLVTHYVQKSIQVGFLFSVFVHLLLLILAINVVIFSRYFPDAFTGVKPERSPIRRTIPEYLFQAPEDSTATPDWSQPVEVETASRVIPEEQRQLPPVEFTEPTLEAPRLFEPETQPIQKLFMERERLTESLPQPTDAPAELARRSTSSSQMTVASSQTPTAPDVPTQSEVQEVRVERSFAGPSRQKTASAASAAAAPSVELPQMDQPIETPAGALSRSDAMPVIGESGLRRQRSEQSPTRRMQPAGAAPAPPTVAIAREDASSARTLAPIDTPITRQGQAIGAQITMGQAASPGLPTNQQPDAGSERSRNSLAARSGMPSVAPGQSRRAPGRTRNRVVGSGFAPAGLPQPNRAVAAAGQAAEDTMADTIGDRLESDMASERPLRPGGDSIASQVSSAQAPGPTLDLMVDEGPIGLAMTPDGIAGVVPSPRQPEIAVLDLTRGTRPRREVGGPVTPFGAKIAAVESFSRRVLRTRGGAAPTPAGMVGPATEEAIERGLAYLAAIQNEDGSWSLQGHGTEVLLRSDTAATGLCLLAFQGAGYTHRQHQYADTVSRGLEFLLNNQRTNGDLYRSENALSDRNVALYSQGIASLALCEAYGMTQDVELKGAAQACLDYIVNTQHRRRGGWRYAPQISADTSVTGWMMMALKSGQLAGLEVPEDAYRGIQRWLSLAQDPTRPDRYRYNPFAPDTPSQRHGRMATPTMTSVGMLMRMYSGWRRDNRAMQSAADYLLEFPPQMGTQQSPQRDAYYWYYATQVMFHMGDEHWEQWNEYLNPLLLDSQIKDGPDAGSWHPLRPVPDRWSAHAGRLYVTTMNLLNLEVYYRHLPIYEDTAE